jgi:hypothetical protein
MNIKNNFEYLIKSLNYINTNCLILKFKKPFYLFITFDKCNKIYIYQNEDFNIEISNKDYDSLIKEINSIFGYLWVEFVLKNNNMIDVDIKGNLKKIFKLCKIKK